MPWGEYPKDKKRVLGYTVVQHIQEEIVPYMMNPRWTPNSVKKDEEDRTDEHWDLHSAWSVTHFYNPRIQQMHYVARRQR